MQVAAMYSLGNIGKHSKPAIPHLIQVLKKSDGKIQTQTILALGGIGPDAKEAIPYLAQIFKECKDKQKKSCNNHCFR